MGWLERREGWLGKHRPNRKRRDSAPPPPSAAGDSSGQPAPPRLPDRQAPKPAREVFIPGVIFHPLRCPRCDSKQLQCRHTEKDIAHRRIVRQHTCRACGWKFKSIETMKAKDT